MLHEALMLEIYRQALNASAMPTARPRSTESANSSERCPSHDSNSSENGGGGGGGGGNARDSKDGIVATMTGGIMPMPNTLSSTFPAVPQNLPAQQQQSMEAYIHMVAAAAQYGFPMGAAAAGSRLSLPMPAEATAPFKLPPQASPNASSNNSEALDYRTNLFGRAASAEPPVSEEDDEDEEAADGNNPLDLSVGTRKRSSDANNEPDSTIGHIKVKKIFKTDSPPLSAPPVAVAPPAPMLPSVSPYLAAVAAASIFRSGQFPDWNGKSDLVIDPLEKMSDIVKGPRKEKQQRNQNTAAPIPPPQQQPPQQAQQSGGGSSTALAPSTEGMSKARHNIWQSHWQNKGVASSVFCCVWCKRSFSTLEALTTHMKDSKHCGVNVPPFGNLPNTDRHHQPQQQQSGGGPGGQHSHNLRKQGGGNQSGQSNSSSTTSAAAKNAFQYRGDPPTPLPRKLVRGQNVWLGKGVEQAMQILKCMRCGESFRSLGEMTKHMQETQHYTNILSQEQTISMKSSAGENKDGQNSMSSEESRTLSAVLTCKVCDKAFNSFADLSSHMAKNNHYSEPLMQSMSGTAGNRKRPAPKKREKSLPVRKLLEMKGAQNEADMEAKMQRAFDSAKRMSLEGTGIGPSNDKSESAVFAERMRQYITGVKSVEEIARGNAQQPSTNLLMKTNKSPDLDPKNGATKSNAGCSSVPLSAIEQMFTTSFDTPPRHASLPATSPSNSSNKNTSPVAASILKRLGIDETADYNKPLIDTNDPYFQHYRYNSSERSGSECSAETHLDLRKLDAPTPEKMQIDDTASAKYDNDLDIKKEPQVEQMNATLKSMVGGTASGELAQQIPDIKIEIKAEVDDEETKSPQSANNDKIENIGGGPTNGVTDYTLASNNNKERSVTPPKKIIAAGSPPSNRAALTPRSPTDSHRSATPKSPASSIKSYDGEKKYPSDSLNALSSMFDSLGSSGSTASVGSRPQPNSAVGGGTMHNNQIGSPENLSTSNSLAALRQFVKKEST